MGEQRLTARAQHDLAHFHQAMVGEQKVRIDTSEDAAAAHRDAALLHVMPAHLIDLRWHLRKRASCWPVIAMFDVGVSLLVEEALGLSAKALAFSAELSQFFQRKTPDFHHKFGLFNKIRWKNTNF